MISWANNKKKKETTQERDSRMYAKINVVHRRSFILNDCLQHHAHLTKLTHKKHPMRSV